MLRGRDGGQRQRGEELRGLRAVVRRCNTYDPATRRFRRGGTGRLRGGVVEQVTGRACRRPSSRAEPAAARRGAATMTG